MWSGITDFFFCFYSSEFFIQSPDTEYIQSHFFNLPSDKAWWRSSTQAQWLDRKMLVWSRVIMCVRCRQGHILVEEFSVSRFPDNSPPGIRTTSSNGWCLYLLLCLSPFTFLLFCFFLPCSLSSGLARDPYSGASWAISLLFLFSCGG